MYNETFTSINFLLTANILNTFQVEYVFKDGTSKKVDYQIDLTPPKPHTTVMETFEQIHSAFQNAVFGVYIKPNE